MVAVPKLADCTTATNDAQPDKYPSRHNFPSDRWVNPPDRTPMLICACHRSASPAEGLLCGFFVRQQLPLTRIWNSRYPHSHHRSPSGIYHFAEGSAFCGRQDSKLCGARSWPQGKGTTQHIGGLSLNSLRHECRRRRDAMCSGCMVGNPSTTFFCWLLPDAPSSIHRSAPGGSILS